MHNGCSRAVLVTINLSLNASRSKNKAASIVTYVATKDPTVIKGLQGQDLAYYGELNNDSLSGLYLSNEPEQLPLVSNNLPPLIAEDFEADDVWFTKITRQIARLHQPK